MPAHRSRGALTLLLPLLCLGACRKTDSSDLTPRPLTPSTAGVNGCSAPPPELAEAPVALPLSVYAPDPMGQVTAALPDGPLYLTGAGGTVVSVDVSDPDAPLELVLLEDTAIPALYAGLGITDAPQVSGLAVLDASTLLVVEHTANVILAVDRMAANQVSVWAGLPNTVPGSADGPALTARFSFEEPCQLCPVDASPLEVYVADSGNHLLRLVSLDQTQQLSVLTLTGAGFPQYADGELDQALFDTPSGLSVTCDDELLLSELGDYGAGQRIRRITFFTSVFFALNGTIETWVGDGVDETAPGSTAVSPSGGLARVSRPVSPLATSTGEVYWVDSGTGVLRRLADGEVDCPYQPACDGTTPDFTPGGLCTLTQTADGTLYVLDAEAGALYRLP